MPIKSETSKEKQSKIVGELFTHKAEIKVILAHNNTPEINARKLELEFFTCLAFLDDSKHSPSQKISISWCFF